MAAAPREPVSTSEMDSPSSGERKKVGAIPLTGKLPTGHICRGLLIVGLHCRPLQRAHPTTFPAPRGTPDRCALTKESRTTAFGSRKPGHSCPGRQSTRLSQVSETCNLFQSFAFLLNCHPKELKPASLWAEKVKINIYSKGDFRSRLSCCT